MPDGGGYHNITLTDSAAASDQGGLAVSSPNLIQVFDDAAALDDQNTGGLAVAETPSTFDTAAAVDDIPGYSFTVSQAFALATREAAGAWEGLLVVKGTAPAPTPAFYARAAPQAFINPTMPRMHLQNLITGAWITRDLRAIQQPNITWNLDQPDTFSCQVQPPRRELLDSTGNPLPTEWQTACYLEENSEIKFGGILTASTYNGPAWTPTFTGFVGYANGIIYEGSNYSQVQIDALDVVRMLWAWVQAQPGGNIGLVLDATKAGVLLGAQLQSNQFMSTNLAVRARDGSTTITVNNPTGFTTSSQVNLADSNNWYSISKISKNVFTLGSAIRGDHNAGTKVIQGGPGSNVPTPFVLDWWNSTDIGQEIGNIATEAVFDFYEQHTWTDATRQGVKHALHFGVPRIGVRQTSLRFAEGENITVPVQGSRDGSVYANEVVGLGAGQGSLQVRAQVGTPNNTLRRVFVYTDQTIRTQARLQSRAQAILTSRIAIDTPQTVVVKNHPNAPFGSFRCGDDILVTMATGWRNAGIWCRITSMSQNPQEDIITLTCARSDSFTYLAQSGQAGTM
jgi:hypothetical protein